MGEKYLIIADDFTGANDTGVQLRRRGYPTSVFLRKAELPEEISVVLDTESRTVGEEYAMQLVEKAVDGVDFSKYRFVVKKIDSTMRGNIAVESWALAKAYKPEIILVAPALPKLGRTTLHGVQRLHGVNVCETELAQDSKNPVHEDDLEKTFRKCFSGRIEKIGIEELRNHRRRLTEDGVYIFDALTDADLKEAVRLGQSSGKRLLYVGTAGIMDNLMELTGNIPPSFAVVSSISSVTNLQIRYAEEHGLRLVKVPVHDVLLHKVEPYMFVEKSIEYLKSGQDTILLTSTAYDREELNLSYEAGRRLDMDEAAVSDFVRSLVGRIAKEIVQKAEISGIFITGGDTAMGVLSGMGADGAEILSEIMVGIPLVKVLGGELNGKKMVTKAGAFGREDAISFAMRKLKEQ